MAFETGKLLGEQHLAQIDWRDYYQKYNNELGVDTISMSTDVRPEIKLDSQIFPQPAPEGSERTMIGHSVFGAATTNWARLMPRDSVIRLKSTEQPYEVFKQIVMETTENTIPELEIQNKDLCSIANHIANRFRGLDFDGLKDDELLEPTDIVPDHLTLVVKSINQRNFEDWHIYAVDDPGRHFDSNMIPKSPAHAVCYLIKNDVEPTLVVNNIAFEIKETMKNQADGSVPSAEPPDCPVTVTENNSYEEDYYYEIESSEKVFGDNWGDVKLMRSELQESSQDGERINQFQNSDVWYVNAGLAF